MSNYEDALSIDELRREVRILWDRELALNMDLLNLPEVPSVETLRALTHAAMSIRDPDVKSIGVALQKAHKGVPYKTEFECAAGLWSLLRSGMIAAKKD
jgi:hypothetical protein